MKDNSFLGNDDIFEILGKTNLSAEMISSVKDLLKELDNSRSEMMDVYKKTVDNKARRYDKQIEHMNALFNKEIEYLIRMSEQGDLNPEQKEELSKKIAEKITDAQKVFAEIIAKANEESDKETAKSQEETARSDNQKIESFNSIATVIAGAVLVLSGTGVVIKNPKNLKVGAGLIGLGLASLGVPAAKKLLPLLQSKDDVEINDA